jgi:hypothetical protein
MIVCSYEDRASSLVGVKLLILSLAQHCPDIEVHIYSPIADKNFQSWINRQSKVCLIATPENYLGGWNIKPFVLLDELNAGFDEVIWLDSDIIITSDFRPLLQGLPKDFYVAAEERPWAPNQGSVLRAKRLGLQVGRIFLRTINSCVNRVTPFHRQLLERWKEMLYRFDYQEAQTKSWAEREFLLGSDQDLLTGLLGSTEFTHIPVKLLRTGLDIAHFFCAREYTVGNRIRNLFKGLPPFVHAQGPKPWELPEQLFSELSPYCAVALPYQEKIHELTPWMNPRSTWGRLLDSLTCRNPNLRDIPVVAIREISEILRLVFYRT